MSTFEIVRGVEGDCLVLDDTRICGPKPWGGGSIIKTFHTDGIYEVIDKDEYRKLLAENAKLRVERDEWRRVAVSKQDIIDHMRNANAENRQLRKENDTLCRRIDELCMEVESLRRTAKRIVKFNHDTDYATGHTECSECRGTVNPCARFCEHCGALFKEGE